MKSIERNEVMFFEFVEFIVIIVDRKEREIIVLIIFDLEKLLVRILTGKKLFEIIYFMTKKDFVRSLI